MPIILCPICRRYVEDNTVQHDSITGIASVVCSKCYVRLMMDDDD